MKTKIENEVRHFFEGIENEISIVLENSDTNIKSNSQEIFKAIRKEVIKIFEVTKEVALENNKYHNIDGTIRAALKELSNKFFQDNNNTSAFENNLSGIFTAIKKEMMKVLKDIREKVPEDEREEIINEISKIIKKDWHDNLNEVDGNSPHSDNSLQNDFDDTLGLSGDSYNTKDEYLD